MYAEPTGAPNVKTTGNSRFVWAMDEVKATLYRLPGMHLYLVGSGG